MKRILRIAGIGVASLVLLFAIAAGVALVVINPNDYKPRIEAAAQEATGKKLQLQGKLSLSVFPKIRIEAGPAVMEDDPSFGPGPFLSVEKVKAAVALMPLFSGKTEIGTVEISGVRLKLAVNEAGVNNWSMPGKKSDAPSHPEPARQAGESSAKSDLSLSSIALDSLSVTDAVIAYTDIPAQKDLTATVKKLEINNARVGQKSELDLEGAITGLFAEPAAMNLSASFILPTTLTNGSHIEAEGNFAGIPFSFRGFAARPQGISIKGEASLGDINLDTLNAPPAGKKATNNVSRPADAKLPPDSDENTLETLRDLFLDLHIEVQSVIASNVPFKKINATIKADQGVITAKPLTLDAFGLVDAEASLDARGSVARARTSGKLENIAVGPLLKAAGEKTPLSGTLNATWNVNATGLSWPSLSKSLNGKATAALSNGNLPAFHLIPGGLPGLPATTLDLTDMRCSATWNIAGGIASNNDLALRAAMISGNGGGSINIPAGRIDYKMDVNIPTIKELPDLTILPIVISGPLASPSYGIDQPALLKQTVKSVIDPSTKVGKEVEKGLRKLLTPK